MPNPLFKPPRHLVKEWPEVFEDLYMNTMPVAYLDSVRLDFTDGDGRGGIGQNLIDRGCNVFAVLAFDVAQCGSHDIFVDTRC